MANDDKDLVSEIKVTGASSSADEIRKFGDDGAAAFDKVASAASKSAGTVEKATGSMASGLQSLNNQLAISPKNFATLTTVVGSLAGVVKTGAAGIAAFATSIVGVATAGAGAVAGVAKFASAVTSQVRGVNDAIDANNNWLQSQKKNNQQNAQSVAGAAQYQSQLNQLNRSVAQGKTSYADYGAALQELNDSYRDSVNVQQQVQQAQDDALAANQRLEKQAADRNILAQLNNTYGVELTKSLITLGGAYDTVANKARDAFGPVLAKLLDKLSALLEKNSAAIAKFIDDAAASLSSFLEANGPQLQQFAQGILQGAQAVVAIIRGAVIPAFQGLMTFLNTVATALNAIFGTNVTGAFLLVIASVAALSSSLTTMITIIRLATVAFIALNAAIGPLGIAIGLLAAALVALALSIDWTAFSQRAITAGTAILSFFTTFPDNLAVVWAEIMTSSAALWDSVVSYVLQKWSEVVTFFGTLVGQVQSVFSSIGNTIQEAFNTALNFVVNLFTSWSASIMRYIKPIIDALNSVKKLINETSSAAGSDSSVRAAGGGYIRGAGTSTSDSIRAWLSDGEYVIKAKSVAKYGLGLLNALNSGKLDLSAIIGRGFNMGGLVTMPQAPRFAYASGGPVSTAQAPTAGTKSFDLHIDGNTFRGLIAPDDVADRMTQFAISRGALSAGRKPGWVGGRNG